MRFLGVGTYTYLLRSCQLVGEKSRYPYFVTALNEMLLHSQTLKSRDDTINNKDIIFAINDPVVIESHHLQVPTKRKPDLVCLLATKFITKLQLSTSLFTMGNWNWVDTVQKKGSILDTQMHI